MTINTKLWVNNNLFLVFDGDSDASSTPQITISKRSNDLVIVDVSMFYDLVLADFGANSTETLITLLVGLWWITNFKHLMLHHQIVPTEKLSPLVTGKKCVTVTSPGTNFARHVANMTSRLFAALLRSPVSFLTWIQINNK